MELVSAIFGATPFMNAGGVPYRISSETSPGAYDLDFTANAGGPVEWFDVYGEVNTRYSQVYWTRNDPVPLPPALVKRFDGRTMAITGYEIDQVVHAGAPPPPPAGAPLSGFACFPSCDGGGADASVPSYNAYNHHYFSWIVGKNGEVYDAPDERRVPNPTRSAVRDTAPPVPSQEGANSIVFKENPGGEFRKSYHGYPAGYAQLVWSPSSWVVEPMQIDTHNRATGNLTDATGLRPSFLPAQQRNNMTDTTSGLSPLIECPCSDRISRSTRPEVKILAAGSCGADRTVADAAACAAAAAELGVRIVANTTVSDASLAPGCALVPSKGGAAPRFTAQFNKAQSTATCGSGSAKALYGRGALAGLVNASVLYDDDGANATLTLAGPDGKWFGIGFGASAMADAPYAIIVDGYGAVTERRLANHAKGDLLPPSVTVVSSAAADGVRTVVVRRSVAAPSPRHWALPTAPGGIDVLVANGCGPTLARHCGHAAATLVLVPAAARACVCTPGEKTYLRYMDEGALEFGYTCTDEPRSDMLRHGDGTGRAVSNAACKMQTYHGGLQCCRHTWFLTDKANDGDIPPQVDRYWLKWRYYFQEYVPAAPSAPASHRGLHHWVFLIDDAVNDYEEDAVAYGTPSVGKIRARLTARQLGLEDVPRVYHNLSLLVMTPHCHAPSCIREELWDADTNTLLCNVTAEYGDARYGSLDAPFNERGYVAIPPCLFGHQPGLPKPWTLRPDANLTAVKYFNNTWRHLGQMAQWTGLMVYDTDPW